MSCWWAPTVLVVGHLGSVWLPVSGGPVCFALECSAILNIKMQYNTCVIKISVLPPPSLDAVFHLHIMKFRLWLPHFGTLVRQYFQTFLVQYFCWFYSIAFTLSFPNELCSLYQEASARVIFSSSTSLSYLTFPALSVDPMSFRRVSLTPLQLKAPPPSPRAAWVTVYHNHPLPCMYYTVGWRSFNETETLSVL